MRQLQVQRAIRHQQSSRLLVQQQQLPPHRRLLVPCVHQVLVSQLLLVAAARPGQVMRVTAVLVVLLQLALDLLPRAAGSLCLAALWR
jgi:hypothetical protein